MRTGRQVSAAAMRRLQKRIGQRLKAPRVELGLSQDHVAKACKLSPSYLSQLEAGLRNPTVGVLYRLSKVLGVKLEDLFR
jgi:transcriptional regulator with XRE-family HTH domain